jgi:hypothetical protein
LLETKLRNCQGINLGITVSNSSVSEKGKRENYAMRMYRVMEVYLHKFLTSALDGSVWSVSLPL